MTKFVEKYFAPIMGKEEAELLEDFAMKCAIRKMQLSHTKEDLLAIYNAYPQFQQNKEFVQKLTENKNRL